MMAPAQEPSPAFNPTQRSLWDTKVEREREQDGVMGIEGKGRLVNTVKV